MVKFLVSIGITAACALVAELAVYFFRKFTASKTMV